MAGLAVLRCGRVQSPELMVGRLRRAQPLRHARAVFLAGRHARSRRPAVLPVLRSADRAWQRAADALRRCESSGTGHGVRGGSRPAAARRLHLRLHLRSPDARRRARWRPAPHERRGAYRVLVLPAARYIPLPTFEHVLALARSGATVVSSGDWPSDIAGLQDLESRARAFPKTRSPVSRSVQPAPTASARRQSAGDAFSVGTTWRACSYARAFGASAWSTTDCSSHGVWTRLGVSISSAILARRRSTVGYRSTAPRRRSSYSIR